MTLRLDAGDHLLDYPGPVLDKDGRAAESGFWSNNLGITAGLGLRF